MDNLGRRLLRLSSLLFGLRLLGSGLFNLLGGDLLQFGNLFDGSVTVGGSLLSSFVSLTFDGLLLGSIAVLCGLFGLAVGSLGCFGSFGSLFLSGSFGGLFLCGSLGGLFLYGSFGRLISIAVGGLFGGCAIGGGNLLK